jgi:hypothetical protein
MPEHMPYPSLIQVVGVRNGQYQARGMTTKHKLLNIVSLFLALTTFIQKQIIGEIKPHGIVH